MNLLLRNCQYILLVAHENQQLPAKISQNDRQCLSSVRATFFTHQTKIIFRQFPTRQVNLGSMLLFLINKQRKQLKAGVVRNFDKFFQLCRFCSQFVSSLVAKNNNTSLFIIISHCFMVWVSNQLAFRVRRAAT